MKQINKIFFIIIAVALVAAPAIAKKNFKNTRMVPVSFAELAKQAKPGVVNIQTVKTIDGGGRVYKHWEGFTNIFLASPLVGNKTRLMNFLPLF